MEISWNWLKECFALSERAERAERSVEMARVENNLDRAIAEYESAKKRWHWSIIHILPEYVILPNRIKAIREDSRCVE